MLLFSWTLCYRLDSHRVTVVGRAVSYCPRRSNEIAMDKPVPSPEANFTSSRLTSVAFGRTEESIC